MEEAERDIRYQELCITNFTLWSRYRMLVTAWSDDDREDDGRWVSNCYAVESCKQLPTFRKNLWPQYSQDLGGGVLGVQIWTGGWYLFVCLRDSALQNALIFSCTLD
jgi:hypothetical protein